MRLYPTFKGKWVQPRIIVPEGKQFNVGSTPGLDVGSSPHSSMGARPKCPCRNMGMYDVVYM